MSEQSDSWRIEADPTKEFFVFMLTRDIDLDDAVTDLIDNSVDGARRLRSRGRYDGLRVEIDVTREHFFIDDNCGGIPVDVARKYAFRFGRVQDTPSTPGSIGQFGVGMKRGLFKLGRNFRIESTAERSRFVVEIDVAAWQRQKEWDFTIADLQQPPTPFPESDRGTRIEVTNLIEDASQQFALDSFRQHLRQEIEAKHRNSMLNGLSITLNGSSLLARPDMLLHSDLIQPGYYQGQITHLGPQPISIQIYAGIGTSKPVEAGWNVYCNGRLVVAHDRTELTGWGDGVPRFHNQFAEFRGYTYLECENAALLPWNTTKSGIDVDSGVYRSVRQRMSELMRPVIDFLNRLDSETTADESDKPLTEAVNATKEVEVSKIPTAAIFTVAATPRIKAAVLPTRRIAYDRPREQIEQVQQVLEVTTLKEVGEATFDYFYNLECRG